MFLWGQVLPFGGALCEKEGGIEAAEKREKQRERRHQEGKQMGARKLRVGIDLGTCFTALAWVDEGSPRLWRDPNGATEHASALFFREDGEIETGNDALGYGLEEPLRYMEQFKPYMGKQEPMYASPEGRFVTASEASGLLLRGLLKRFCAMEDVEVEGATITIPAHFDHRQRQDTREAAMRAGLREEQIRLLQEPTAGALAYVTLYRSFAKGERLCVFDLGGGTLDLTLLEWDGVESRVLGIKGDGHLGGRDFDDVLRKRMEGQAASRYGGERWLQEVCREKESSLRLGQAVIEMKHRLSERGLARSSAQLLGRRVQWEVERQAFEKDSEGLLESMRKLLGGFLRESKVSLRWEDITGVLLIGGATRMPMIRKMVEAETGRPVLQGISPSEAVVLGAALHASGMAEPRNIAPYSLGLKTLDARGRIINQRLIEKDTTLPAEIEHPMVVRGREVCLEVLQGEDENPDACRLVGRLLMAPPSQPGQSSNLRLCYRNDGTIEVVMQDPKTGESVREVLRDT